MHKKALLHKVQHPIFAGHSFLALKALSGKHKAIYFFYNFHWFALHWQNYLR